MPLPLVKGEQIPNLDLLSFILDNPNYDTSQPIFIDATDPDHSLSYSQSIKLIRQIIAGLHAAGLKQGDVVCIHSFNNIYYPILCLAIIGAGGTFVGTNPSYTQLELEHAVRTANVSIVISEPEILGNLNTALSKTGINIGEKLFIFDHHSDQVVSSGLRSWKWLHEQGERDWVRFDDQHRQMNTTAVCFFTSGTTGLPKCAMITHRNLVASHQMFWEPNPRPYKISTAHVFPLFHAGAFPTVIVSQLKDGRQAYLMKRFDLKLWLSTYDRFKLTEVFLAPPMVVMIIMSRLADPDAPEFKYSLRSVRNGYVGAAPLSADLQKRFLSLLAPDGRFTQIWGMSETCSQATSVIPSTNNETHLGSIGQPLPHVEIKLIDESGKDVTLTERRGEAAIRGPGVIRGYLNNPSANAESWDSDGFYKTGDVMEVNPTTNLLYVVERRKELIKVRGFQVAPAELEGALTSHPDITDAAVIGVPDDRSGELPRAYIVLRKGAKLGKEEIAAFMKGRLAGYKALEGGILFVDEIPKLPSGKILKRVIREWVKKEMKEGRGGSKL